MQVDVSGKPQKNLTSDHYSTFLGNMFNRAIMKEKFKKFQHRETGRESARGGKWGKRRLRGSKQFSTLQKQAELRTRTEFPRLIYIYTTTGALFSASAARNKSAQSSMS